MRLSRIRMELDISEEQEFSYQKASLMQGVLMEWLTPEYAEKLHTNGWNPYSQYLEKKQGKWYWIVNIFQEEAFQEIYPVLMNASNTDIFLKHGNQRIKIAGKETEITDLQELMNEFYFKDSPRQICIRFKTPTAFKQKGGYLFVPDIGCILKSMIHKYDAVTSGEGNIDEDILDELLRNIQISRYHLRSTVFHMEGVKIPAFLGEVKFVLRGTQTLANYIHFLFQFASYSGIGIKASMGMGAIEIVEKIGMKA